MSREKLNSVEFSSESLRQFAKDHFGSLKGLSEAMGISPQHLAAYLNGTRAWGAAFREKLAEVGFAGGADQEIKPRLIAPTETVVEPEMCADQQHSNVIGAIPDLHGACRLLACSPEELAQRIGASRKIVPAWEAGEARPSYDQLVMLYHQVLAIAVHCCEAERRPATEARQVAAG